MAKLSDEKINGRDQRRRRRNNDECEEELALTLSRPTKRQKEAVNSTDNLFTLPSKLCRWLREKFIRPLPFMPASFPASFSSSEWILCNNNNSSSGASGPDLLGSSKYDVFISFRGADVRNSFLSHLYSHLYDYKKLAVYKDDVDLERGEQISAALLLAIERSDVYIVILSPNYADSPWCLEELERILQCKERYGRRVIPVFYGVDPSDIENQKLPSALREIAKISGFDSQVIRPETKLIDEISKAVFQAIRSSSQMVTLSSFSASRGLVGVDRKIQEVQRLLCYDERGNQTIGLWGMPGIGKTALAWALYDLFSCQFEASYFFSDFRDALTSGHSLQRSGNLQSNFFSNLLGDENGRAGTSSYDLTLHRLGRLKALVVIDDVGNDVAHVGAVNDLLNGRYCDLFGPGSIVIMTSRNRQLLKSVCHQVYEVSSLDDEEALQLFCSRAFKGERVQATYEKVVKRAIEYAGGNPLAITVLGSHLYGRDLEFWGRELDDLQDNPNPVVESILRKSYDGLSPAEKEVFLNLACFYSRNSDFSLEVKVELILDGGRQNAIANLVDKSLLRVNTVGADSRVEMDGLLRDLGRSIVNEESQIGKRLWLWKAKDVQCLFKENKGTISIKGIVWDLYDTEYMPPDTYIQPNTFEKMEDLRFLSIRQVICNLVLSEEGLECLPNALRILEWHFFAAKCLPSQFSGENLVKLDLTNSKIEQLWESERNVDLGNLTSLDLPGCNRLRKLPNLSAAKKLTTIVLQFCVSLVELPTSILHLPMLKELNVRRCSNLKWNNLERYADGGQEQNRPHSDIFPNLQALLLSQTPVQKVPDFIIRLNISGLYCTECTKLTEFPLIPSLTTLDLRHSSIKDVMGSEKLTGSKNLAVTIGNLIHLESLDLSGTPIVGLPSSIGDLTQLESLYLDRCKSLASLPDTIHKLSRLISLVLSRCDRLTGLPELPSSLIYLDAHGCKSLQTLPSNIEEHDFSCIRWQFGQSWKLDPLACSKLVDKFTNDSVGSPHDPDLFRLRFGTYSHDPHLLLPAKWVSKIGGGERSIMGSSDSINNTMVRTTLRGQPWKLKSLIVCALLNSPALPDVFNDTLLVECVLLSNNDDARAETVSRYDWKPVRQYEDEEECLSKGYLLVWSICDSSMTRNTIQSLNEKTSDDGATVEFFFRAHYKSERHQSPNLIRNCRVIPVYNDRAVTYIDEEDNDDDQYQSPDNIQGLYSQLLNCAAATESASKKA